MRVRLPERRDMETILENREAIAFGLVV